MGNDFIEQEGVKEDSLAIGARGGAIAFILKILSTAMGFMNQIILARVLGAGGLGEVLLAISVVRIVSHIAKFGMEEAMMRFVSLYLEKDDRPRLNGAIRFSMKLCLALSLLLTLVVIFVSKFISVQVFHSEGMHRLILVIAVSIPAVVIREVIGGILKGYKDAFRAILPESIVPVLRIAVFLLLLTIGVSPLFAIFAYLSGEFAALFLALGFLNKKLKSEGPAGSIKCEKNEILDVASSVIFTGISVLLFTQADLWILKMFMSAEAVGVYGVAAKIVILVYYPMMAFASIVPPLISSLHASGNQEELKKIVSESTRWILSMAMPVILVLILEGKFILQYIYGSEFSSGYVVLVILAIAQLIKAGVGLVGVLLQMTGEHRVYMKLNLFWGVINIIMNIILVPRYGLAGAAIATAFCLSMIDIMCVFIIHKKLSVLTIARGMKFDILFIAVVTAIYLLLNFKGYYVGQHLLLFISLTVYIWKSVACHDIPWRSLIEQYKKA